MASASLPPGFRFHPTDVELILYYLKRKLLGNRLHYEAIAELDLYKFSPWDLPDKSCLQSKDLVWYFFCPRNRKHGSGSRASRATENGYWKTTGRDRAICNDSKTVGTKKTLIFHLGRAPHGTRTDWVMHEYKLAIKDWIYPDILQDAYVLCKIFEKSGLGPKNGEQHVAQFQEEEWEDDLFDNSLVPLPLVDSGSPSVILDDAKITVTDDSTPAPRMPCESSLQPCQNALSDATGENLILPEDFDMDSIFAISGEENDQCHNGIDSNEMLELLNYECIVGAPPPSDDHVIFGCLEDLNMRTKLQGIDNLDLASVEENYALGQTLLGDGISYIELDDLEIPLGYPVRGDDNRECFSAPSVSSVAAFGVGSSGCMFLKNSVVFAENLDVDSSEHFGHGGSLACGYEDAKANSWDSFRR